MNILLAHFRVGETDGVSLEMDKWRTVLEEMGHQVYYLSGSEKEGELYLPELSYLSVENTNFVNNAYIQLIDYIDIEAFKDSLLEYANRIETKLIEIIQGYNIDLIIPNNIWSLGWNLAAGIAFTGAIDRLNISAIGHHHDFFWEREKYSNPTSEFVQNTLEEYFPPANKNIQHVVINQIAKKELLKQKGLNSTVIPNVFDFDQPQWEVDEYNSDLRKCLGLSEQDIVILQATRITERKAIELAVEMTGLIMKRKTELYGLLYDGRGFGPEDKIVLLMPGLQEAENRYIDFLQKLADENQVELILANEYFKSERERTGKSKYYSLWDAYTIADIITYPSILEGWGNQFLEGVFSRKPMAVFEYPVFSEDIKDKGFIYASFGSNYTLRDNGYVRVSNQQMNLVTDLVIKFLKDNNYYNSVVNKNFTFGKKYFSYQVLADILKNIINTF